MINWIKIEDEIPEEGKRLLYFFEGTGVWTGFYYGRDEEFQKLYAATAKNPELWESFKSRYLKLSSHEEYLEMVDSREEDK